MRKSSSYYWAYEEISGFLTHTELEGTFVLLYIKTRGCTSTRMELQLGAGLTCFTLLIPVILTAESRGMMFFLTSSRGPGLRASFSFRSSASHARFSLIWTSREVPSEAGSAQHTAAPHHQQHTGGNTAYTSQYELQDRSLHTHQIQIYEVQRIHLFIFFIKVDNDIRNSFKH